MTTQTQAADRHTTVVTGWTNPSNAYSATGDNVYATAVPGKNATVSGDFGFPSLGLPAGVTITALRIVVEWNLSAAVAGATLGVLGRNNGVDDTAAEVTKTTTTEAQSTFAFGTLPSVTDLNTAGRVVARTRGSKGNTTTALTCNVDFVRLEVDYIVPNANAPDFNQLIGDTDGGADAGTTVLTVTKTLTVGNSVVVGVTYWATGAAPTCADNLGNVYALIEARNDGTRTSALFVAPVTVGGSLTTITVTHPSSAGSGLVAAEFVRLGTLSAAGVGASGTTSPATWATSNTIPGNGIAIGFVGDALSNAITAGAASGTASTPIVLDRFHNGSGNMSGALLHAQAADASAVTGFVGTAAVGAGNWMAAGGFFNVAAGGTVQAITGAATGTGAASGSPARVAALAGSASGLGSASGSEATTAALAATANGVGSASGGATATLGVWGAATGAGAATATIGRLVAMTGAATGTGGAAGGVARVTALTATAAGIGTTSGPVATMTVGLTGAATGVGLANGGAGYLHNLAGSAAGAGAATGAAVATRAINGAATGIGSAIAAAGIRTQITGAANGAAAASGSLGPAAVLLTGAAAATGTATGSATLRLAATGAAAGSASATGATTRYARLDGAAPGTGQATAVAALRLAFAAAAVGSGFAGATLSVLAPGPFPGSVGATVGGRTGSVGATSAAQRVGSTLGGSTGSVGVGVDAGSVGATAGVRDKATATRT